MQAGLGARWAARLPGLLGDPATTHTRASYKQRTYASAESFLHGAFGQTVDFPHTLVPALSSAITIFFNKLKQTTIVFVNRRT